MNECDPLESAQKPNDRPARKKSPALSGERNLKVSFEVRQVGLSTGRV